MSRTVAPPITDKRMWKRVLRLSHPDSEGGDAEVFRWLRHMQELITDDEIEPPHEECVPPRRSTRSDSPRVPFDPSRTFDEITAMAVAMVEDLEEPYRSLLRLLSDAKQVDEEARSLYRMQRQGASYKSLAAVGHKCSMNGA